MTAATTPTQTTDAPIAHVTSAQPLAFDAVRMRMSPAEAERRHEQLLAFVQKVLVVGVDYGDMPGTDKKALFKPGGEKIAQLFGLTWRWIWREAVKDWEKGFFYFESECTIIDRETGVPICNSIGSCNSRESKYGYRWEWEDACRANGIDTRGLKVKTTRNGSKQFRVPNDDPYSIVNTIQKMANKRSFVGAVIAATASSGIFTQDVEDFSDETLSQLLGDVENVAAWKKGNATDKRGDLIESLEKRLADAKTDQACRAVGVTMTELVNAGQLKESDAQGLRIKINARREEAEIKATVANGNGAKKPADTKPADAKKETSEASEPSDTTGNRDTRRSAAPEGSTQAPEAPKSEPKSKPVKRAYDACGEENDGCVCTLPKGHDEKHHDEKTDAEW
jgi:hypothetical protein